MSAELAEHTHSRRVEQVLEIDALRHLPHLI
jgi:hypothetical protein